MINILMLKFRSSSGGGGGEKKRKKIPHVQITWQFNALDANKESSLLLNLRISPVSPPLPACLDYWLGNYHSWNYSIFFPFWKVCLRTSLLQILLQGKKARRGSGGCFFSQGVTLSLGRQEAKFGKGLQEEATLFINFQVQVLCSNTKNILLMIRVNPKTSY